jgi:hypothetical protein
VAIYVCVWTSTRFTRALPCMVFPPSSLDILTSRLELINVKNLKFVWMCSSSKSLPLQYSVYLISLSLLLEKRVISTVTCFINICALFFLINWSMENSEASGLWSWQWKRVDALMYLNIGYLCKLVNNIIVSIYVNR